MASELYPGQYFYSDNNPRIARAEAEYWFKQHSECPHSHLPIDFLKQLGKVVEKVGAPITETAIIAALKGVGGAFENE